MGVDVNFYSLKLLCGMNLLIVRSSGLGKTPHTFIRGIFRRKIKHILNILMMNVKIVAIRFNGVKSYRHNLNVHHQNIENVFNILFMFSN